MNRIEDVISRPDFRDRAIFLTLRPLGSRTDILRARCGANSKARHARHPSRRRGTRRAPAWVALTRPLPRMAGFSLWAAACETAMWPAGTFARAYAAKRRRGRARDRCRSNCRGGARDQTARSTWTGPPSDLLRSAADLCGEERATRDWSKNPRALAGRLRRGKRFSADVGTELGFTREGRAGTRIIRLSAPHQRRHGPKAKQRPELWPSISARS